MQRLTIEKVEIKYISISTVYVYRYTVYVQSTGKRNIGCNAAHGMHDENTLSRKAQTTGAAAARHTNTA